MNRESLGTIVSSIDGPSPSVLSFVVNEGKVHKGMFIELEYSEGTMVCLVEDVVKTNRYFERPDSVKTIGAELEKNFPVSDWEFLLGRARPLGVFVESNGNIQRSTFPPSPGTKVFKAKDENLKKFLALQENGLHLGSINFHDVLMKVNLSKLLQKHLAILAMSGAGKSYCVSVLLEELLLREKENGQIAVIVFDTHGEYTCFGESAKSPHKDFSSVTKVIDASKIKIASSKLTPGMIANIMPDLSAPQKRELSSIISRLSNEMKSGVGPFDLAAVRAELSSSQNQKTAETLLGILSELEDLELFSKIDYPAVSDIARPGQLCVLDLSKIISDKKKQIIVSYFSNKLFNERRQKRIPPFALFVEEAHNFIPETTSKGVAIAKSTLRTIAREGRKFGAALVVISQRPKRLDTTTLANCNTNIILRITNPYDLDHIKQSSEGLDQASINSISSLRVGEALIVGEAVGAPTFFRVRLRTSQPSKHEVTLEEAAKRFSEQKEKNEDEINSFL